MINSIGFAPFEEIQGIYLGKGNKLWKEVLCQCCEGSNGEEELERAVKLQQGKNMFQATMEDNLQCHRLADDDAISGPKCINM